MVTSTLPSPSPTRAAIGSGPNAEKSGENTPPSLQRAEARDVELRDRGSRARRRGRPSRRRARRSAFAKRFVSSSSSRYVRSRTLPSLAMQRSATRSPRVPVRGESTASCAMLSPRPPGKPVEARAAPRPTRSAHGLRRSRRGLAPPLSVSSRSHRGAPCRGEEAPSVPRRPRVGSGCERRRNDRDASPAHGLRCCADSRRRSQGFR